MADDNSVIIYKSFYDGIKSFDPETRDAFWTAVMEYVFYGNEIEMPPIAKAVFTLARPQIDANIRRRENGSKGAAYGGKGGRPRKTPMGLSEKTPMGLLNKTPMGLQSKTPNVNDNVNVNVNVNGNVNDNVSLEINSKEKKDDKSSQKENRISKTDLEEIATRWNALPDPVPRVTVLKPGTKRYESLAARVDEYGIDAIMTAIETIKQSSFLCGKSSNWHISFDWFVLPNNFPKVYEGNYTDSVTEQKPKVSRAISVIDDMIAKGLIPNDN